MNEYDNANDDVRRTMENVALVVFLTTTFATMGISLRAQITLAVLFVITIILIVATDATGEYNALLPIGGFAAMVMIALFIYVPFCFLTSFLVGGYHRAIHKFRFGFAGLVVWLLYVTH